MRRVLPVLLLVCLFGSAMADEKANTQKELEAARRDIAELKKVLGNLQQEKGGVEQELRGTEKDIGDLQKQIDELEKDIQKNHQQLQRLDEQKNTLEGARLEQQRLIAIQARAAYQSGARQEYLKLLLNQQNPEQFARVLTYYDYLSQARGEQLHQFNETLRQLVQVQQDIDREQAELGERRSGLDARRGELAKAQEQRRQTLAKLDREYASGNRRLSERQKDSEQLAEVLRTIEATLARQAREAEATLARQAREAEAARARALAEARRTPQSAPPSSANQPQVSSADTGYGGPFANARGKLPWPVDGRLVARYGAPRGEDSRSTWDGVLIGASDGAPVHAVHGGRVVFADWLRGAGLLVIIDHGGGYLTLYGHNQSLRTKAGALVKTGETVATVGRSGGQQSPALYFAIRQQGRPTDPSQWCRAQG